jgi:DNA-binding beta-propeller fold protein YncE
MGFSTGLKYQLNQNMKQTNQRSSIMPLAALLAGTAILATTSLAQADAAAGPYKILKTAKLMGTGGIDYVTADSDGRKIYVPRGNKVLIFDLDTLKEAGSVTTTRAHGVAVDPKSHHAFCSSSPVVMWDTETLATIKTIPVEGGPDGIYFEPSTERVFVFSHRAPNITVLDAKDGSIVGTVDLGGAPEQAQSDGTHLFVDLEDKDSIAVVDLSTLKVTATYSLGGKGGGPGGLGLDAKNHILFAMCHEPAVCVILSSDDGKILDTQPIGDGTDSGGFNPNTLEAFSSQRDGTLTIIKEKSPTSFEVEQNVKTIAGAKTCSLDTQKNQIVLIAVERSTNAPAMTMPPPAAGGTNQPIGARRGGRGFNGPGLLDILVVGQ